MDEMKEAIIDRQVVADICQRNDIAFLGVFGSYARGEATAESDIDLLVRFSARKSLFDLVDVEQQFAERLGRPVDLVTEDAVSPYLKDRIKKEVKTVYEHAG